jgi:hypothetical protein
LSYSDPRVIKWTSRFTGKNTGLIIFNSSRKRNTNSRI